MANYLKRGIVYLAYSPSEKCYKLGFTTQPIEKRIKQGYTPRLKGKWYEYIRRDLKLIYWNYGTLNDERVLHSVYAKKHVFGEFFQLDEDDIRQVVVIMDSMMNDKKARRLSNQDYCKIQGKPVT